MAGQGFDGREPQGGAASGEPSSEFRILGPIEVVDAGGTIADLPRRKQRALLALLVLSPNRVVSVDRLVARLWPEEPPANVAASLQSYVSNLRRVIRPDGEAEGGGPGIVRRPPGYVLEVDPGTIDAVRFQRLLEGGEQLLAARRPAEAADAFAAALALWRGPALADVAEEPFAMGEAARLEDLRLVAHERRLEAELMLGRHALAVGELRALAAAHPFRERLWALLMLALYRDGRQAEALRAFRTASSLLVETLGAEPGPALRALEADILAQAPALALRPDHRHRGARGRTCPRSGARAGAPGGRCRPDGPTGRPR